MDNIGSWDSIKDFFPDVVKIEISEEDSIALKDFFPVLMNYRNVQDVNVGTAVFCNPNIISDIKLFCVDNNCVDYTSLLTIVVNKIKSDIQFYKKLKALDPKHLKLYGRGERDNAEQMAAIIKYYTREIATAKGFNYGEKSFFDGCKLIFQTPDEGDKIIEVGQVLFDALYFISKGFTGRGTFEEWQYDNWSEEVISKYSVPKEKFNINQYLTLVSRELYRCFKEHIISEDSTHKQRSAGSIITPIMELYELVDEKIKGKSFEVKTIRNWLNNKNY